MADIHSRLIKHILNKPIRIAVVAPSSPREFFELLWKGAWSAACELSPFGVRVESFETDGHDLMAQQRILRNFRAAPPAAVALAAAHVSALDQEIAELAALGVPVITVHADAPSSCRETYVGTAAAQSGALAGEMMAKLMHGRGKVASFPGSLETAHLAQRYVGFRNALKRLAPEIEESVCHAGFTGLAEAAERILAGSERLDGIYVGCSRAHLVAEVLARSGKRIPCVGFDLTDATKPFLESGTISALIDEDIYHQGYLAVQQAYEASVHPVGEKCAWLPLPAHVVLSVNSSGPELGEAGVSAFELILRRRSRGALRNQELLEQANAKVVTMTETDSLTGLWNRTKFEEILSARAKADKRLSLLTIGLNGFQRANGSMGQPVSDEALRAVAKVLRTQAGPLDYCARTGGDEFCILMPGTGREQANDLHERIGAALAKTVIAPQTLHLGLQVRIGVANIPADASNAEDLLVRADSAMYVHSARLPM